MFELTSISKGIKISLMIFILLMIYLFYKLYKKETNNCDDKNGK